MDPNTTQKIAEFEQKIDMIYSSVEKTRKYLKWTVIITVVMIVLPIIGLLFAVPSFMTNYVGNIEQLSQ